MSWKFSGKIRSNLNIGKDEFLVFTKILFYFLLKYIFNCYLLLETLFSRFIQTLFILERSFAMTKKMENLTIV